MLVRTISQLPRANNVSANGLFEFSVPNLGTGKYTSYALDEGTLQNSIHSSVSSSIKNTFRLESGTTPISVDSMLSSVNALLSGNQVVDSSSSVSSMIDGIKCFKQWPAIYSKAFPTSIDIGAVNDIGYLVPNVNKVHDMLKSQPMYFSSTDSIVAEGNPLPSHQSQSTYEGEPGRLSYQTTIGAGKFYFWSIDQNGTDSSETIYDPSSKSKDGYQVMQDTGWLVMWGWLADSGVVAPEKSWVGLYAQIKAENGDVPSNTTQGDIPLAIQPWIRGQYASTLQYVGFTVPVKKGLRLKVKTGFPVSNDNSGFQNNGTMTFIDRWVPNAFFGYIIK